jgi:outer membrane protein assembly factor BamB
MTISRTMKLCLVALLVSICFATSALAENWPQWRGAKLDGISQEKNLPVKWSKTENVAWRLPLPGPAGSTPVIWDDRIFLTSIENDNLLLLCVDTSGKEQWRQTVGSGNKWARGDEGNSAAPSPSTDGKHVWVFMGTGVLGCYTVEGKEVWKINLQDRYGRLSIAFGMTSTPVLDNGRLFIQLIHGEGKAETREAMVAVVDATNGNELWKQPRITGARNENEHSYASPMLYRDKDREYLLTHGGDYTIAHNLKDGSEIWRCCLNPKGPKYHETLRFVASPLAMPGMIVVPSAKGGPVFAIKPDAMGDITESDSAYFWKRQKGTPDVSCPLAVDGLTYLYPDGLVVCLDSKTGEEIYTQRPDDGVHRASPVYADGKIYFCSRKGVVLVVKAGREYEVLAKNDMGEVLAASPAISGGRIYLRTYDALYAIGSP